MADYEKIREAAQSAGGEEWGVLADAMQDTDFQNATLTQQEKQVLGNVPNRAGDINRYRDHYASIVSKYLSWQIYKKSGFQTLKKNVSQLNKQVDEAKTELDGIEKTAKYIGGATVLVKYSEAFDKAAKSHESKAKIEQRNYLLSLAGFAVIVGFVFFVSIADVPYLQKFVADDVLGLPLNTGFLALKIILLLFAFQIMQFFRKNYGAERHLEEVYNHRRDVLQSLHAVYNALSESNTEERDKILSAGALFAYERGETGYITTKEGAGAGDDLIGGLFSKMFHR